MEEKDQKIQEMERQMGKMQQRISQLEHHKRRRPWKIVLIVLGVIAALIAAAVLVVFVLMSQDKESPAMAEKVIQAIIDQDTDGAYALMYPGLIDSEEFAQGFEQMCRVWIVQGGGETFQIKRTSWHMESNNGTTQYTTEYTITSGEAQFTFSLVRMVQGENAGMTGAHIGPGGTA